MEQGSDNKAANATGLRIRELRLKAGLTQMDLAARIEVQGVIMARSTLAKIENQSRSVNDWELLAISKSLKIRLSDLF